jgi:hypothetical protein
MVRACTILIAIMAVCCSICWVATADLGLEKIPVDLKDPDPASPYADDAFMSDATSMIGQISNMSVPMRAERNQIYGAYIRLRDKNVSPGLHPAGLNIVAYLFYTAKAGESAEAFVQAKNQLSSTSDGSDYYKQAQDYHTAAAWFWKNIQDQFPNMSPWYLPDEMTLLEETETSVSGTVLPGLDLPIAMAQKDPNPASPYASEKVQTLFTRWVEDYVEYVPTGEEAGGLSNGTNFMNNDGVEHARATWKEVISENVDPDFYDTANYIGAFFYYLSQAKKYYDDYIQDRTSVSSTTTGEKNYAESEKYFNEANKTLGILKGRIPNLTEASFPEYPKIDEVVGNYEDILKEGLKAWEGGWQ